MSISTTTDTLDFEAFCETAAAWNEMVAASAAASPFVTHQWIRTWWRHFGAGHEFFAPVVRSGSTLLAGVPLATRRRRLGVTDVLVGEIVGTAPVPTRGMGLADRADLVARRDAPDAAATLAAAVVTCLDRVDVLDLKGLDTRSPAIDALRDAAPRPARVRTIPRSVSPYVELPDTWEAYLASRSRNLRAQLKKHRRQLDAAGEAVTARWTPGEDLAAWMAEVKDVDRASWKAERGTDLYRHPAIAAFMLDLAASFGADDHLDLRLLRLDGRAIAHDLCFDFAGSVQSYNHGYVQTHRHLSPGTVITAASIESAITRGRREYDLLRGGEGYKSRWSDTARTEVQLLVPAPRLAGAAYTRAAAAKARLKRQRWLAEIDDRVSGLLARIRHRDVR